MKRIFLLSVSVIFSVTLAFSQNPLDEIAWNPEPWSVDAGKSELANLNDLLTILENEAKKDTNLWFLEAHFSSLKVLLGLYPPDDITVIDDMIAVFSNPNKAGGPTNYLQGNQQLLMTYNFDVNTISFVTYNLPSDWDPGVAYPLYTWGREGGLPRGEAGVFRKYEEQISGGSLPRAPSARFKDGYTLEPWALSGGDFSKHFPDFMLGMDKFIEKFKTDNSKYYLGGFSAGGRDTYYVATTVGAMDKYKFAALAMYALSSPRIRLQVKH